MRTKKGPQKISGLVVAALRNLRDAHGSSPKEIMKYIMAEYNASEATVQRQLKMALKRGVEYGILKKTTTGYSLNTDAEVIGPLDLAQMDACGKKRKRRCKPKRASCKPKRRCPRKRKPRCPKKRKRNPCNVCASRGHRGDCSQPVQLVRDNSPSNADMDDEANESDTEKRTSPNETTRETRSRSGSRRPGSRRPRSRSQSEPNLSASEDDDDKDD